MSLYNCNQRLKVILRNVSCSSQSLINGVLRPLTFPIICLKQNAIWLALTALLILTWTPFTLDVEQLEATNASIWRKWVSLDDQLVFFFTSALTDALIQLSRMIKKDLIHCFLLVFRWWTTKCPQQKPVSHCALKASTKWKLKSFQICLHCFLTFFQVYCPLLPTADLVDCSSARISPWLRLIIVRSCWTPGFVMMENKDVLEKQTGFSLNRLKCSLSK